VSFEHNLYARSFRRFALAIVFLKLLQRPRPTENHLDIYDNRDVHSPLK